MAVTKKRLGKKRAKPIVREYFYVAFAADHAGGVVRTGALTYEAARVALAKIHPSRKPVLVRQLPDANIPEEAWTALSAPMVFEHRPKTFREHFMEYVIHTVWLLHLGKRPKSAGAWKLVKP